MCTFQHLAIHVFFPPHVLCLFFLHQLIWDLFIFWVQNSDCSTKVLVHLPLWEWLIYMTHCPNCSTGCDWVWYGCDNHQKATLVMPCCNIVASASPRTMPCSLDGPWNKNAGGIHSSGMGWWNRGKGMWLALQDGAGRLTPLLHSWGFLVGNNVKAYWTLRHDVHKGEVCGSDEVTRVVIPLVT